MPEFHDALETRTPETCERAPPGRLPELITRALEAPGWAKQLARVDAKAATSRAALAALAVPRKSDLKDRQRADPPFGGLALKAHSALRRLLISPGPIFEPPGQGADFWGAASALFAGTSPCGRTGLRLKARMGRADQVTRVKGMFVHPSQVAEIPRAP